MRRAPWIFGVALAVLAVNSAAAAPVLYTNAATFNAATSGFTFTTQNFNAGPTGLLPQVYGPMTVSQVNFSGSVTGAIFGTGNSVQVSTGSGSSLTFTFTTPINAFGADLFDLGTVGATTLGVSTPNGGGNLFTGFTGGGGNQQFVGVTDTTPFTSITFTNTQSGDFLEFDNVRFAAAPVPEPSTFAIFGIFLVLGIGCYVYRRRTAVATSVA